MLHSRLAFAKAIADLFQQATYPDNVIAPERSD